MLATLPLPPCVASPADENATLRAAIVIIASISGCVHNTTAELGQAEKSPVAVPTQGGSNSLKGGVGTGDGTGHGDAAAVPDERIKKRHCRLPS